MAIIKGRWRDVTGGTVIFQKNTFIFPVWLMYFLFLLLCCLLIVPLFFIFIGVIPLVPKFCYVCEDYTDESNEKYKAMERLNQLADEFERLTDFIAAEDKRLNSLRKKIADAKGATKGYSKIEEIDTSDYKTISLSIFEPEKKWLRILKPPAKGVNPKTTQQTEETPDVIFLPKEAEQFSRSLDKLREEAGADELVYWELPDEKNKGKNSSQNQGKVSPERLNSQNKIKGESDWSYKERKRMITSGETVPDGWDWTRQA